MNDTCVENVAALPTELQTKNKIGGNLLLKDTSFKRSTTSSVPLLDDMDLVNGTDPLYSGSKPEALPLC